MEDVLGGCCVLENFYRTNPKVKLVAVKEDRDCVEKGA